MVPIQIHSNDAQARDLFMKMFFAGWLALILTQLQAQVPDNLVAEGLPPIAPQLKAQAGPYLQFRAALLSDWHPINKEILVLRRATDSAQLFTVASPGRAPVQLTSFSEPVSGGLFQPHQGKFLVFAQDK